MARFIPLLSTIGVLRLFGVSFGQRIESLAPSVRQFARATSFRAAGYQAAADEIIHIRQSASEVRSSRRKLTIPVLVITGGRGADENWRQLQRDQASLSERGCLSRPEIAGPSLVARGRVGAPDRRESRRTSVLLPPGCNPEFQVKPRPGLPDSGSWISVCPAVFSWF